MKPIKKTININTEIEAYNYICMRADHELIRKIETQVSDRVSWVRTGRYVHYKMYDEYNRT